MKLSGYSGTPLAKKLGIKNGHIISVVGAPVNYLDFFDEFPEGVTVSNEENLKKDLIHYFVTRRIQLVKDMYILKNSILQNGCIWISWPKKSSKVPTDITEDTIRNIALQNGLVDIKVCSVDDIWSALKLVIPVKDRK